MTEFRFGFALTTVLGNETRYVNLRKYVDRDGDVECVWAPITHYLDPDPYRRWPGPLHTQRVLNHQASELFRQWERLDAVVVHAFQLFCYLTLYRRVRRGPLLALFQDYAPFREVTMLRNYGHDVTNDLRRKLRFQLETRFTRLVGCRVPIQQAAFSMAMSKYPRVADVGPR